MGTTALQVSCALLGILPRGSSYVIENTPLATVLSGTDGQLALSSITRANVQPLVIMFTDASSAMET